MPFFCENGRCYKFRMTHPDAGNDLHRDDHGSKKPCGGGGEFDPYFSDTMGFSRTFHSDPNDKTPTHMTIFANDGKPFGVRSLRPIIALPENAGPTELILGYIDFYTSPTEFLRYTVNTFEANIDETFSDVPHSSTYLLRTVAHNIPLQKVQWIEYIEEIDDLKVTDLPMDWYEFWSEWGIKGVSTFSKELVTFTHYKTHDIVHEWRWKMKSFKTEWKIPIPLSSRLLGQVGLGD
jgi:hypothetical protein